MSKVIKGIDVPAELHKAGEVIFTEGSEAHCFYIVKKGEVDILKNHGTSKAFHVATIHPGHVIGEVSVIDGQLRWATAVAKTDVEVTKVSAGAIRGQLSQCPPWFRSVILDIVERFRQADELLVRYGLEARDSKHTMSSLKGTPDQKSVD
jgi:CRP-like cAMP-binding protein